jgi:hypothetical protein
LEVDVGEFVFHEDAGFLDVALEFTLIQSRADADRALFDRIAQMFYQTHKISGKDLTRARARLLISRVAPSTR